MRREILGDFRVFRVRKDVSVSPVKGTEHAFFVLEGADWVNVVALTDAGEMLFVRQWRHGTEEETLEIPGGCVDPDDASPLAAAQRELREETGYVSERLDRARLGQPEPRDPGEPLLHVPRARLPEGRRAVARRDGGPPRRDRSRSRTSRASSATDASGTPSSSPRSTGTVLRIG